MRRTGELRISPETIYRHVWADRRQGGTLYRHLRGAQKRRRKRHGAYDRRGRLAGKRHISERPAACERRTCIGHWEMDTVLGAASRACVLSVVERQYGYLLLDKLAARTTHATTPRLIELIHRHRSRFDTITADNGLPQKSRRQSFPGLTRVSAHTPRSAKRFHRRGITR
jgi:IS30 family transposase